MAGWCGPGVVWRRRLSRVTCCAPAVVQSRHQLEDTYARWLKRTDNQLRAAFDAYDAAVVNG